MGVYIKDMEMPKTCKSCYLSKLDPGLHAYVCQPTEILIDCDIAKAKRLRTVCPLVPVSPHGRLIDADALLGLLTTALNSPDVTSPVIRSLMKTIITAINDAPTIIPAEEGET